MAQFGFEEETEVENELQEPHMFKVIFHNDDYTTMDFVVKILIKIFHKNQTEAESIMWKIHEKGKAVVGIYTYEIAQTKVKATKSLAKENGFPLLVTIEEDG